MGWFVAAWLVGCTGEVEIWLVDPSAPEPGEELVISSLELTFEGVSAHTGGEWRPLARGPSPYNLLDFSGDTDPVELAELRVTPARLARDELPVGRIDELRLRLDREQEVEVEGFDGVEQAITLVEGTSWTLPVELDVRAGEVSELTLGIDVRGALEPLVGGGFAFAPEIEVVE